MVVGGEVVIVVVLVAEVVDAGVVGDMVVVVVVIVVVLLILLLFLKPWCCCQCWSAKACLRLLDHGFWFLCLLVVLFLLRRFRLVFVENREEGGGAVRGCSCWRVPLRVIVTRRLCTVLPGPELVRRCFRGWAGC